MNLNVHEIIGRAGSDPMSRTFKNGTKQVYISIATNAVYYRDEEKVEETDWHTVICFNKIADVCLKYVKKGMLLYVAGRHKMRTVIDEKTQNKRLYSEILATKLLILEKKQKDYSSSEELPF
jgi:single-strand DNA-binding protein